MAAVMRDSTATFRPADVAEAPASELLNEMVAEMMTLYGITGRHVGVPLDPSELMPPTGVYLVGWIGESAVAGGGLRTIGYRTGEIKRMYVRDQWRGQSLAAQLLAELEDAARHLDIVRLRLDTGSRQPHAQRLYQHSGYRPIDNYNDNPDASFWAEKILP